MNENFNRQFILFDFKQLDDPAFLDFVGTAEFRTFLILLRYVWRGGRHRLGLDNLYNKEKLLVAAIQRGFIAKKLNIKDERGVSKYLKKLEDLKIIRRLRTGRETIFILGEWIDISEKGDGSVKKEWFYYERVFGKTMDNTQDEANNYKKKEGSPSEVVKNTTSEVVKKPHQSGQKKPTQTWQEKPYYNKENKIDNNTVNVNAKNKNSSLQKLPDLPEQINKAEYLAKDIVDQLGDQHSINFYRLTARKIPETIIRQFLSEIKSDGADNPARLFTYKINKYADENATNKTNRSLKEQREKLAKKMKNRFNDDTS